jgi:MATE family, multidrug efflux pump
MTRLVLFALPLLILSRRAGFEIREVWYLSVASQVFQACLNLILLRRELRKKLSFPETNGFLPGAAVF